MFVTGRSNHQVDDKGRVRIPVKFKDALGPNPFISVGYNGCLNIFPKDEAEKILDEKFGDVSGFTDDPRLDAMRKIFSRGDFVEEDKQGRIALPQYLLDYGKITKNVISIGMRNHIELWAEEVWEEYDKRNMEMSGSGNSNAAPQAKD